jgi:hypothetical protein
MLCLGLVGTGFDFALHAPSATSKEDTAQLQSVAASVRSLKPSHKVDGFLLSGKRL